MRKRTEEDTRKELYNDMKQIIELLSGLLILLALLNPELWRNAKNNINSLRSKKSKDIGEAASYKNKESDTSSSTYVQSETDDI